LANGGSDLVNRLGVRGENKSLSWLKYELPLLENVIESVKPEEKTNMKPVMIVGAGLSAADAVVACRNAGIDVIHVFRSVGGGSVRLICD
jgi:NADPH-dependent glutamate synthase beta subunit-like oxidoreductase